MICPYCQHELTADALHCPRCRLVLPRPGARAAANLRLIAVMGGLFILCAIVLSNCVIRPLSNGGASLSASGGHPDAKSAEVQNRLRMWQKGQQSSQNPAAPPPAR